MPSDFQIGDRVRISRDFWQIKRDMVGTIVDVCKTRYKIAFDGELGELFSEEWPVWVVGECLDLLEPEGGSDFDPTDLDTLLVSS